MLTTKTKFVKKEEAHHDWYIVDAEKKTLGRMATRIATVLMGKHKPSYTPHVDTGDFVIVINAGKVRVTGEKLDQKTYSRYSGYPGGLKVETMRHLLARKPADIVKLAVKRMVPRTKLGRKMFKKLKVYAGPEHPHEAQVPKALDI